MIKDKMIIPIFCHQFRNSLWAEFPRRFGCRLIEPGLAVEYPHQDDTEFSIYPQSLRYLGVQADIDNQSLVTRNVAT